MQSFSVYLVAFVAIEHLYFLYLEIFMWTRPLGRRVFGLSKEDAQTTKVLALNQGAVQWIFICWIDLGSTAYERSIWSSDPTVLFTLCVDSRDRWWSNRKTFDSANTRYARCVSTCGFIYVSQGGRYISVC